MTQGAVRLHAREPDLPLREADGQILAGLVDKTERGPAAGQLLGADIGQHLPQPIRSACGHAQTDGAVFELLGALGKNDVGFRTQEIGPEPVAHDGQQHDAGDRRHPQP
jgi:hypothetical protein